MSFLHTSLIGLGSALVAIPILLHLLMRQKPKHAYFPALRFVQRRNESNRRKLRLRHWALLALRCAAIALLAAAFAKPKVASALVGNWLLIGSLAILIAVLMAAAVAAQRRGLGSLLAFGLGGAAILLVLPLIFLLVQVMLQNKDLLPATDDEPVAAVILVDVSPRMAYRFKNQTRLELAKEMGDKILRLLPPTSDIGLMDNTHRAAGFAVDRATAKKALDGMVVSFAAQPLNSKLREALLLLGRSRWQRRELYIVTDMSQKSWPQDEAAALQKELAEQESLSVYVIDVSAEQLQNVAANRLELSTETAPAGAAIHCQVEIAVEGQGREVAAELLMEQEDPTRPIIVDGKPLLPESQLRGRSVVTTKENESTWVDFTLRGLEKGTHHGSVRLNCEDGLSLDDQIAFTIRVEDAAPILIVSAINAEDKYLSVALAPIGSRKEGQSQFRCDSVRIDQLPNIVLKQYAAVALLDPAPLATQDWDQLADYVRSGGGLAIFLGRNASPIDQFNRDAALPLLPGSLQRQWRSGAEPLAVSMRQLEHPVLRLFRPVASSLAWTDFPVYRHWTFQSLTPASIVVLRFTNDQPAIVETTLGEGRTMTMTTPISDALNVAGREPWNRLPTGIDPLPYFMLVNEMFHYLTSSHGSRLNYVAGQTATLPISVEPSARYQLFTPDGAWQELGGGEAPSGGGRNPMLRWRFTDTPGTYRLKSDRQLKKTAGFSVSMSPGATSLQKASADSLDNVFGKDHYQLASDFTEIHRDVGQSRHGRDFFDWILVVVVVALSLEHLLANRFYPATAVPETTEVW